MPRYDRNEIKRLLVVSEFFLWLHRDVRPKSVKRDEDLSPALDQEEVLKHNQEVLKHYQEVLLKILDGRVQIIGHEIIGHEAEEDEVEEDEVEEDEVQEDEVQGDEVQEDEVQEDKVEEDEEDPLDVKGKAYSIPPPIRRESSSGSDSGPESNMGRYDNSPDSDENYNFQKEDFESVYLATAEEKTQDFTCSDYASD